MLVSHVREGRVIKGIKEKIGRGWVRGGSEVGGGGEGAGVHKGVGVELEDA
jgi:hypothetical protein